MYHQKRFRLIPIVFVAFVFGVHTSRLRTDADELPSIDETPFAVLNDLHATVKHVTFSNDGRLIGIASGTADKGFAFVYDVGGRRVQQFTEENTYHVAFSHDDSKLAIAAAGGKIHVMNLETGSMIQELTVQEKGRPVQFSPNGRLLVSGDVNDVVLWDTQNWNRVAF